MKKIKTSILMMVVFSFAIFITPVFAENESTDNPSQNETLDEDTPEEENKITIVKDSFTLEEFSSAQIDYTVSLPEGTYSTVIKSSDESVASVDASGQINALKSGDAVVTILVIVNNSTTSYSKDVKVNVFSTSGTITFDATERVINRGTSFVISYELSTQALSNRDIVWVSSNPSIATVVNGKVTGVEVGTTVIKATIGSVSTEMTVQVVVPLSSIEFNPQVLNLEVGQSVVLPSLIYVPYDTTDQRYATYTVQNEEIIALKDGYIRALKVGKSNIQAKIGDIETILEVTVVPQSENSDIQKLALTVIKSEDTQLTLRLDDSNIYQGNKYEFSLPIDVVRQYVESRASAKIVIVLDDLLTENLMKYFEGLTLDASITALIDEHKLEVAFVDANQTTLVSYRFNQSYAGALNLKFKVSNLLPGTALYKQLGAPGYQLRFYSNGGFPSGTRVSFNPQLIGNSKDKLHFLYLIENDTLVDTNQEVRVDDRGLVQFEISDNQYVVAFTRKGATSTSTIMLMLSLILVIIVGFTGSYYIKQMKQKKKL